MPSALASFLTDEPHATPSEREALLVGNPLVKFLDADPSIEIVVLGAVTRAERVTSFRHRISARRRAFSKPKH